MWQRNSVKRKYGCNRRHHPDFYNNTAQRDASSTLRKEARSKFKTGLRQARNKHMETRIREISEESKRVWDLGSWTGPRRSSMATDIIHDGWTLSSLDEVWPAMNATFHSAINRPTNATIVDEVDQLPTRSWPPFSSQELCDAIAPTTSSSAPGADHVHW